VGSVRLRGRSLRQRVEPAGRRAASALASGRELRQALARSETTLKQTLELTRTGSWDWDIRTNVVRWSENLGPMHGLPAGSSPRDYDEYIRLVHPDDRARLEAAVETAVRHGRGYDIEFRTAPRNGEVRWLLAHANVIRDDGGEARSIVGLTRDITDRKRREERAAFLAEAAEAARLEAAIAAEHATRLQEVTAGLSAAATTQEIAEVIIEQGIPALSASTGILAILEEPDVLRFVRTIGYGDVFPERLGLDEPWPITQAVRTRRLVELRDLPERRARFDVPERIWEASGHGTLVAVPLLVGDRPVGAIGFTREQSTRLTASERDLVETLARQAALALERASLYEADLRGRLRAEGLQRVTSAIATAATMREVASAVASEALEVLGASGVTVILASSEEVTIGEVLASNGSVAAYATSEPRMNFEADTVTGAAIRSGTPAFVETAEELETSWPVSASVAQSLGVAAVACIPLRVNGRRGAVSIVFDEPRRFLPEERTFLDVLARTCEQGLLRAALYEAERDARTRSGILHGLSATLSGAVALADVGTAFLEHALGYLRAGSGSLMLADATAERLTAAAIGGSGATRAIWASSLPVDGEYVASTSFRRGEPVAAWTREALERDFAATARHFGAAAQAAYARPLNVGGRKIGVFALVFEAARELSADDEQLLATMADLCGQAIERARLYESEHQIAHRLQSAMLPERVVRHPNLEIAAHYQAGTEAMEVGGDWYDTFSLPDGKLGIAVGDVLGQGIEAAAAMGRLRSALSAYALEASGPADLMARLNRFAATPSGVEFATACYAVIDPRSGALSYASAGHPPMLLLDEAGASRWLEGGRTQPLCGSIVFEASEATERLEPGDLLVLYSDGLVERRGEHIGAGLARLEDAVRSLRELPVDDLCDRLVTQLRADSPQPDDMVVVAIRAIPTAGRQFRRVFPALPEELRFMRAAARTWLDERRLEPTTRSDVVLALAEACANAVEHAYGESSGEITVEISMLDQELALSVSDSGRWRDEAQRDPDRGRGYQIMEALSTRLEVDAGPMGTTVRMRFDYMGNGSP
jgi:PAS domain S-box-containing protein